MQNYIAAADASMQYVAECCLLLLLQAHHVTYLLALAYVVAGKQQRKHPLIGRVVRSFISSHQLLHKCTDADWSTSITCSAAPAEMQQHESEHVKMTRILSNFCRSVKACCETSCILQT
jgi:hypothetical protein